MKDYPNYQNNDDANQDPSRQLFSSSFANQKHHQVPEITLPKGGGALKGIDEKFEVNPVNGTNSVSIPFPISPARSGFSPSLAISYNSGGGNGLFGVGWGLSLPNIRRKTDKELPRYQDSIDSDTYILAGAEDLIPQLKFNTSSQEWLPIEKTITFQGVDYLVKEYRPRIEGAWIRIERWTSPDGFIHWRTISTNNVITIYGIDDNSRIANPADPLQIFEWLIAYSYDNLGNIIRYEYKEEKLAGVANTIYEKNRNRNTITNRYLKRVHYGNARHYTHGDALPATNHFFFETVLDYGEHSNLANPIPTHQEIETWTARPDAFSSFRSGFDIRTYRLCKRVLLFHKFANEQTQPIELVASIDFDYSPIPDQANNHQLEGFTYLREATSWGYIYDAIDGEYKKSSQPPLSFDYQAHAWNTTIQTLEGKALEHAPTGINNSGYQWTDLYGEGLSGILMQNSQAWYYKQNWGGGEFSPAALLHEKPSMQGLQFQSLEGNSEKQLVNWSSEPKGFFDYKEGEAWQGFQPFEQVPNRNLVNDPNVRFVDLDGDGRPDLLITEGDLFQWHPSTGKKGFGKANQVYLPLDEEEGPRIVFADQTQSIYLADMTGDGMTDIVRIKNGTVCYWANQGYGNFSAKITMANAPQIEHDELFHPRYLQLVDIDGSGTTDIAYLYQNSIQIWMNHNGNNFATAPKIIHPFPPVDNQVNIDIVVGQTHLN